MLSIPHLIIIFVVALVVFGPEKLPELARNLGKVMGEFKRATGDLRGTFEGHLRDLERETEQRRIGATPPVTSAEGTVSTNPPKQSPTQLSLPDVPDASAPEAPAADTSPESASPHAECKSEIVSDGSTRPA
jgi:sec-independent protein translocase protein TatB